MKRHCIPILFIWITGISVCKAQELPISVHYNERVPYLITTPEGVKGLTGTPVALAFKNANIQYTWKKTPPKRQLKILKDNSGLDCIAGWFKNSEREKFAKYTHFIYQDKKQIALTKSDNKKLYNHMSTDAALSSQGISLLLKDGYSYGAFLDKKIIQYRPTIYKSTIGNIAMLKMLQHNRVDYFFISYEEADSLIESSGIPKSNFKYISFSDMPKGEKRYLLCSKKVGDDIIERLNSAILDLL